MEKYENLGEVFDNTKNLDLETIKSKIRRRQEYLRQNKVTLKSETVRSLEEVAIANYLYLNGINYEYEKVYPYDDEKNNRKLYRQIFIYLTMIFILSILGLLETIKHLGYQR